ncbi:hypothetical protein HK104_009835 [Borealophlyctis nickersoniae]|nr:hypothetical protein HK104_009835 [Borealophlyctis nickersoniae]
MRKNLKKLRMKILTDGLPENASDTESPNRCSLRGKVWKIVLGVYRISGLEYLSLIDRGRCDIWNKITNDTFRTLATDKKFWERVDESMLKREEKILLVPDLPPSRLLNLKFSYVQGMNVLAAPFLYVMTELDAFYSFLQFIQCTCPLYVQPALEGVHCGLKLLDKCLKIADPELYKYLRSKRLTATVYAFPSAMTFCACTPPLDEVLKLWDFLLAFGVHLNILCIIAQLVIMRTKLLQSPSPMKILRTLPELDAREVIAVTLTLVPVLPETLYDMLVRHPYDPMIYDAIMPEQLDEEEEETMGVEQLDLDGHE